MTASDAYRLAYLVVLLAACGYALLLGGRPERQGAGVMLTGSVLSVPAAMAVGPSWEWDSLKYGLLIVDLGVLAAFVAIALASDRFWPLWATGFHIVAVAIHFAILADPAIGSRAYSRAQPFWAYPMLVALVIGTICHVRRSQESVQERSAADS